MIIDSHEHVRKHGYGADDVIAEMDTFGITLTWLLTWYLPPNQHVPGSYGAFNPSNIRPDGTHGGIVAPPIDSRRQGNYIIPDIPGVTRHE